MFLEVDTGADLRRGCRGCAPPSRRWPAVFFYNWYSAKKKTMWFIGVEVEKETKAPPPKKNPGSAPGRCQPILQKVFCLCGIAAETWLRIPRKRTGEDHTIIINTIFIKN